MAVTAKSPNAVSLFTPLFPLPLAYAFHVATEPKSREFGNFPTDRPSLSEFQTTSQVPISLQNLHDAGMSIVVFDPLLYGHAEEDSLFQGGKLSFGKIAQFSRKFLA
jgi:hypothetical protein